MRRILLSAIAAIGLAGCAASPFDIPETQAARVQLSAAEVAGTRVHSMDEKGSFTVDLSKDGKMAGYEGSTRVTVGTWAVDAARNVLCFDGDKWWKGGSCWEVYGGPGWLEATSDTPLKNPSKRYPVRVEKL